MKRAKLASGLIVTLVVLVLGGNMPALALTLGGYELFGGSYTNMNALNTITGNVYSGNNSSFNADVTGNVLAHGYFNGNGGLITGNLDALNNINGSVPVSGSKTQNDSTVPLLTLDSNATVLAALAGLGSITTITGNHTFTAADPAGIYHVTGDVNFTSGLVGDWTIIGDGNINGASNVKITSFIAAGGLFSDGLAIYDATGYLNNFSGTFVGAVAAGNVENLNGVTLSAESPVTTPEPSTMMLLGAGFLGLAVYGKRRKNA